MWNISFLFGSIHPSSLDFALISSETRFDFMLGREYFPPLGVGPGHVTYFDNRIMADTMQTEVWNALRLLGLPACISATPMRGTWSTWTADPGRMREM